MSFPILAGCLRMAARREPVMRVLAELAGWPEWLVWCAASAGGILAVAVVICVIEALLDLGSAGTRRRGPG